MATNFKGLGRLGFRETATGIWRPIRSDSFTLNSEFDTDLVESFPADDCGALVAVDSKEGAEVFTATVGINSIDDTDLEILFNQKFAVNASIDLPNVTVHVIPAGGVVNVAGLTATSICSATILNDTAAAVQLTKGGTASVTQFAAGANTATFDSSFVGKTVSIFRMLNQTNVSMIGGTNVDAKLGELELFGIGCHTRSTTPFKIWLPRLKRSNGLAFESGADTFETEYNVLTKAGFSKPYAMWK
jgi:hypothetical protein